MSSELSVRRLRRLHAMLVAVERASFGGTTRTEHGSLSERVHKSVLFVLAMHEGEPIAARAIAERLGSNPSTVGRSLRWLMGCGLVRCVNESARGSVTVVRDEDGVCRRAAVYGLDLDAIAALGVDRPLCEVFNQNPEGGRAIPPERRRKRGAA